jgi:hypothetical protein
MLQDPVVLFQTRTRAEHIHEDVLAVMEEYGENREWRTERVFMCAEEGRAWLEPQMYNYESCEWRFYAVPCMGELARLLDVEQIPRRGQRQTHTITRVEDDGDGDWTIWMDNDSWLTVIPADTNGVRPKPGDVVVVECPVVVEHHVRDQTPA